MTNQERNDYFYVCALIEYISRATRNHRGDVVRTIGKEGIEKLLYDAQVNHCLSFEQVSDEVIEYYKIKEGTFDTISNCHYDVPSYLDIRKLYSIMIVKIFYCKFMDSVLSFRKAVRRDKRNEETSFSGVSSVSGGACGGSGCRFCIDLGEGCA